ncbi:MAG TPA: hypothetical protein PKI62_15140 [bacterium]|nr:hypothetical protein [bacterium]HPR88492.1 hypothetical protein [bacterium]
MDKLQTTKKWLKIWASAAPALQTLKQRELADPDYYQKNLAALNGMLSYAASHATWDRPSGLVEQQRLFKKLFLMLNGMPDGD